MTIATASFKMDSPKITEYNLGSTCKALKIAKMVTGSVADRVEPKSKHSMMVKLNPSNPNNEYK